MLQQRYTWPCAFCNEIQEGLAPALVICKPCFNAWKDIVLEKRRKNEKENKKISKLLENTLKKKRT